MLHCIPVHVFDKVRMGREATFWQLEQKSHVRLHKKVRDSKKANYLSCKYRFVMVILACKVAKNDGLCNIAYLHT